jgi:hypothetical protein
MAKKITEIKPALLQQLRTEINAALAKVAAKNGVVLKAGNCSYTATTFTFKLEGTIEGGETKEEAL